MTAADKKYTSFTGMRRPSRVSSTATSFCHRVDVILSQNKHNTIVNMPTFEYAEKRRGNVRVRSECEQTSGALPSHALHRKVVHNMLAKQPPGRKIKHLKKQGENENDSSTRGRRKNTPKQRSKECPNVETTNGVGVGNGSYLYRASASAHSKPRRGSLGCGLHGGAGIAGIDAADQTR